MEKPLHLCKTSYIALFCKKQKTNLQSEFLKTQSGSFKDKKQDSLSPNKYNHALTQYVSDVSSEPRLPFSSLLLSQPSLLNSLTSGSERMERDEAARSLCLCTSTAVVNVWRVQTYTKTARAAVSCNGEIIQKSVEKTTTKRRGKKRTQRG